MVSKRKLPSQKRLYDFVILLVLLGIVVYLTFHGDQNIQPLIIFLVERLHHLLQEGRPANTNFLFHHFV